MSAEGPGDRPVATEASRASLAWEGARHMTPMVLGIVPFGLALGATIAASSVDPGAGAASAPLILAGAAQLATVQMLDTGTAPLVIVVSALLINVRILLYGASLAPWFAELPLWRRLLVAAAVIDQTHFVCTPRFQQGDLDQRGRTAYYAGAAGWLIAAWLGAQAVALVLGAHLPDAAHLEMAAPLALVGLLAKSTADRPAVAAAVAATAVAAVGAGLPLHSSVLVAILVGMAAGIGTARATTPAAAEVEP